MPWPKIALKWMGLLSSNENYDMSKIKKTVTCQDVTVNTLSANLEKNHMPKVEDHPFFNSFKSEENVDDIMKKLRENRCGDL